MTFLPQQLEEHLQHHEDWPAGWKLPDQYQLDFSMSYGQKRVFSSSSYHQILMDSKEQETPLTNIM
ncbi:hypothetical protein LEMLEM_LOCUS889 [Lemmus lemmus]